MQQTMGSMKAATCQHRCPADGSRLGSGGAAPAAVPGREGTARHAGSAQDSRRGGAGQWAGHPLRKGGWLFRAAGIPGVLEQHAAAPLARVSFLELHSAGRRVSRACCSHARRMLRRARVLRGVPVRPHAQSLTRATPRRSSVLTWEPQTRLWRLWRVASRPSSQTRRARAQRRPSWRSPRRATAWWDR